MNERYSRQILFQGIGEEGQTELQNKHVLLIGAGALGTSNAEILVRSGVGKLTLADRDYVEWSNLQRQQLYTEQDAHEHMPKAISAKQKLEAINQDVTIKSHIMDVTPREMEELTAGVDLIIDATDNFEIRMIINDAAQKYRIPWIYGSIVASYGLSYTVIPGSTPCLYCLLGDVLAGGMTCDTAGVINPVVQRVVSHQSVEALKILTNNWVKVRRELISFDIWENSQSTVDVDMLRDKDCPSCGNNPVYPFLNKSQTKTEVLCGRNTVQIRPVSKQSRNLESIAKQLSEMGQVEQNSFLLQFRTDHNRMVMFKDGRVLIHGTNDATEAKSLYHKFFG